MMIVNNISATVTKSTDDRHKSEVSEAFQRASNVYLFCSLKPIENDFSLSRAKNLIVISSSTLCPSNSMTIHSNFKTIFKLLFLFNKFKFYTQKNLQ